MNKIATLWQGASYQDHLLQSYRLFHFILQSVLLAIGSGLFIAILFFDDTAKASYAYVVLLIVTVLAIYLLMNMSRLIKARAEDVDYYHNQLIESESTLPREEQVLTAFKVYQKFARTKADSTAFFLQFQLTSEVRTQLTEKGKGHTRKILDHYLFLAFLMLWTCIHLMLVLNWVM